MKTEKDTKQGMMSFDEFMAAFRCKADERLQVFDDQYDIDDEVVMKNSTELHGLIVRSKGKNIAPVFYYEDFYGSYLNGESVDECVMKMTDYLAGHDLPGDDFARKITSWEEAKECLTVKLINANRNRKLLTNVPCKLFGDMAVIVQILISSQDFGSGTVTVDADLIKMWNVEEEELFNRAFDNMRAYDLNFEDLSKYASPDKKIPDDCPRIYVLRYQADIFGASAMLYTDKLQEFAEKMNSDFYIMPVSIHEALMIEYKDDIRNDYLFGMLNSINQEHPIQDDILSYEVFRLKRGEDDLTYITDGRKLCIFS